MEEKEIGKKNNSRGLVLIVVVLIIIVIVMGAYIAYDKGLIFTSNKIKESENNLKEENTNDKEETIDIDDDLVQNLYSIFRFDKSCYMSTEGLNNNNLIKLRIAYDNISKQNIDYIECSKLELSDSAYCGESMTGLMIDAYNKNDLVKFKEYEKQNYTEFISSKLIEVKVHELFGSDDKIKHESFGIDHVVEPNCNLMKYDSTNDIYARFSCEGGGTCGDSSQELVSAYKKNDELYIITNIIDPNNGNKTKVTYTFKKDKKNSKYVFKKVSEQ